jgi:hypothetical protein
LKRVTELVENLKGEKCDLAFVILFVVEIAIAAQTATGHAFDIRHFDHRKIVRLAAVVPDEIMAGRNVKMTDFHDDE